MPIDQKDPTDEISVSDRHEGYVAYTEYLSKKKDTGTVGQWKAAREAFEEFLQMNGHSLGDVGRSEANAFFEFLKRYDLTGGTAARYATWILTINSTPNQILSTSSVLTIGMNSGVHSMMMAQSSMTMPRIRMINIMVSRMPVVPPGIAMTADVMRSCMPSALKTFT